MGVNVRGEDIMRAISLQEGCAAPARLHGIHALDVLRRQFEIGIAELMAAKAQPGWTEQRRLFGLDLDVSERL